MQLRKSWREKLASGKDLPKVVPITGKVSTRWGTGTMLIPNGTEVDGVMRTIPKGMLTTVNEIRAALAKRHGASIACPLMTGMFAVFAARAAAEDEAAGKKRITPCWRTLKAQGELNPKYPGGVDEQGLRLEAEGHSVVTRGKRFFVQNHESRLKPL